MKKIALLLATLLVFGILAGCNAEEEKKVPDHTVPGYAINLYTGAGWTAAEETQFDLELTKDGVTMLVMGFAPTDFVDMPTAKDLYLECNDDLFEEMTELSVKEKDTTYKVEGNKFVSGLFSAKDGDTTYQYYCFGIQFDDEAGSVAWICFRTSAKDMKAKKAELKAIADQTDANGKAVTQEELDEELNELLGEEGLEATGGYEEDSAFTDGEIDYEGSTSKTESSAVGEDPDVVPDGGNEPSTEPGKTEATETTEATGTTEATE